MYSTVVVVYILLTLVFLAGAAFIFRHFRKYGYLSPRFRPTILIFGLLALLILSFSFYLLLKLWGLQTGSLPLSSPSGTVSF